MEVFTFILYPVTATKKMSDPNISDSVWNITIIWEKDIPRPNMEVFTFILYAITATKKNWVTQISQTVFEILPSSEQKIIPEDQSSKL